MTDFSTISHDDTVQAEAVGGGKFVVTPIEEGTALVRLREVIETGVVHDDTYDKDKKPVKLVFEAVFAGNGSHAVTKEDGTFVRNKDITVRVNKGFNERGKYRPLFNKLNYAGKVPTVKGECPSMHHFLGQAFLVTVTNNTADSGKVYSNLDKDGVYQISAPIKVQVDDMGMPTGETTDIVVPEMTGDQVCFLWESSVSDDVLKSMWASLDKGTYEKDGVEHSRSFERMDIMNTEMNKDWDGSREQQLLCPDAIDLDLGNAVPPVDMPSDTTAAPDAGPAVAVDPLEGL